MENQVPEEEIKDRYGKSPKAVQLLFEKRRLELLSNNEEYIQFIENQHNWYWKVIDNIGWYYLAKEYKDEASDKVSEFLVNNNFSIEEIANLHNY